ncbi:hypothetical protein VNI00_009599 [Paramarasmius palmivorus]|uniref:Uncharacterized protein n=1 Tax=Paramarasmius palmivorus TaxID=297713 RepID=A0AAW0CNE0_9AGAR
MLSLPQPHPETKDGGVDEKESCVVPVPEDSKVMRAVLLFCYPGRDPVFTDIDEIKGVVGAVMKYEMQDTIAGRLKEAIHPFTCKEPLRIFSIASHFKWRELAQAAAKASLHFPLQEVYVQELELINAGDYHRLLKYHQQCGIAAANVTTNCGLRWMRLGAWTWLRCQSCPAASSTFMCITDSNLGAMPVPVRAWFMDYMVAMGVALKRTPSSRLLDSIDSIIPFIPKIGQCQTCRAGGFVEMRSFIPGIFKAEVERAIAQVEIEITF